MSAASQCRSADEPPYNGEMKEELLDWGKKKGDKKAPNVAQLSAPARTEELALTAS